MPSLSPSAIAGTRSRSRTRFADLWRSVRQLDDLTADALLVCLAHWATTGVEPDAPVWITADAILDARGIQRMHRRDDPAGWQHGHRREDRLAAGRALAQLDSLWLEIVDVGVVPGKGDRQPRRIRTESRALAILDRVSERDPDSGEVFLAARIVPGEWARMLWETGLRQTGLLARQALAYDPYRERPERWLARYLALASVERQSPCATPPAARGNPARERGARQRSDSSTTRARSP